MNVKRSIAAGAITAGILVGGGQLAVTAAAAPVHAPAPVSSTVLGSFEHDAGCYQVIGGAITGGIGGAAAGHEVGGTCGAIVGGVGGAVGGALSNMGQGEEGE